MDAETVALRIMDDPRLVEALKRIVQHERRLRERYPDKPSWWEWEAGDVGIEPWILMKLVRLGIVERTYASSRHKYYRLAVDLNTAMRALARAEGLESSGKGRPRVKSSELVARTPSPSEIPGDLFEVIEGHDEIKWLLRKSLTAERYHVLLVGPPATAKTLFLLELSRIPGSYFIDATHSTKVGLRELILEVTPRYLLIDEIDKVRNEDFWNGLANIMETGKLSYAKHGKRVSVQVNVNIYATANFKSRLPEHILSRFEVIDVPPYDDSTLERIIMRLLTKMYGKPRDLAKAIAHLVIYELGSRDVRDAIKAAKVVGTLEDLEMYKRLKLKYRSRPSPHPW